MFNTIGSNSKSNSNKNFQLDNLKNKIFNNSISTLTIKTKDFQLENTEVSFYDGLNNSSKIIGESAYLYDMDISQEDKEKIYSYYDSDNGIMKAEGYELLFSCYLKYQNVLNNSTQEDISKFETENKEIIDMINNTFIYANLVSYSGKFDEMTDFQSLFMPDFTLIYSREDLLNKTGKGGLLEHKDIVEGKSIKELMLMDELGVTSNLQKMYSNGYGDFVVEEVVRGKNGFSAIVFKDVDGNYFINYNGTEGGQIGDVTYDGFVFLENILEKNDLGNINSLLSLAKNVKGDFNFALKDENIKNLSLNSNSQKSQAMALTRKYLKKADEEGTIVNFGGYSLGGSLAETSMLYALGEEKRAMDLLGNLIFKTDEKWQDNVGSIITYNGLHAGLSEDEVKVLKNLGQDRCKFFISEGDMVSGYNNFEDFKDFALYISPYETYNISDLNSEDLEVKIRETLSNGDWAEDELKLLLKKECLETFFEENKMFQDINVEGLNKEEIIDKICEIYFNNAYNNILENNNEFTADRLYKEKLYFIYRGFSLKNRYINELNNSSENWSNVNLGVFEEQEYIIERFILCNNVENYDSVMNFVKENSQGVNMLFQYAFHNEPSNYLFSKNGGEYISYNFDDEGNHKKNGQLGNSSDENIALAFNKKNLIKDLDNLLVDLENSPALELAEEVSEFYDEHSKAFDKLASIIEKNEENKNGKMIKLGIQEAITTDLIEDALYLYKNISSYMNEANITKDELKDFKKLLGNNLYINRLIDYAYSNRKEVGDINALEMLCYVFDI